MVCVLQNMVEHARSGIRYVLAGLQLSELSFVLTATMTMVLRIA